jgi:hypothetical protein
MAEDTKKDNLTAFDDLDRKIEEARLAHELAQRGDPNVNPGVIKEPPKKNESVDDPTKLIIDRNYLTSLREEAKSYRKEMDKLKDELGQNQGILKQYFQVDTPQALAEKLEDAKKQREKDEEAKLSKIELGDKKRAQLEKTIDEMKVQHDVKVNDLVQSRNKIIVQNALIQAAIRYDVANPKQLLRLLENEFQVDPDKLVPQYKAEDGIMSLDERVKIFLDEQENWNLVRSKIPIGAGSQGGSTGGQSKKMWTKDEISKLRREDPKKLRELDTEIQSAYREGRVK